MLIGALPEGQLAGRPLLDFRPCPSGTFWIISEHLLICITAHRENEELAFAGGAGVVLPLTPGAGVQVILRSPLWLGSTSSAGGYGSSLKFQKMAFPSVQFSVATLFAGLTS